MKIYQKLASLIGTSCNAMGGTGNYEKFRDLADDLTKAHLPHGSGFNSGIKICWDKTNKKKITLQADFYHDNDDFCGWTCHEVVLTPDWDGFDMKITGRDKNGIKDYIGDTLAYHLTRELPAPAVTA